MAVMHRERCCQGLLLLLHSVAAVHGDTAPEAGPRVAASAAETAGNLLSWTKITQHIN